MLLAQGVTVGEVCKKLAITEQTYYRWRKEYGSLRVDQAKRLKGLEKENQRLKKLLAEAALDKAILKEAASGNGSARQNDARPWSTCGMVWDGTESPSEGLAGFWASLARRSVATLTYRTTSHGWCETWSDWPPSTVGTATAVCPRCFAGKAGR